MPRNEERPWSDPGLLIKDNLFHRKVYDLRRETALNQNEQNVRELLTGPSIQPGKISVTLNNQAITDEEIDSRAFYDKDSSTYNLRYMVRNLSRELTRCQRYGRQLSLLVVAIDNLARISQQHGAVALDSAVAAAANTLLGACRIDIDMVSRYMDDRFLIVCPETTGRGALVLAERIRKKFGEISIQHHWHVIRLSASVGIAQYPTHGKDLESLIAQADIATEVVTERGGDGVCLTPNSGLG